MSTATLIMYTSLGVFVSVILPMLAAAVREIVRPSIEHATWSTKLRRLWKTNKKYVVIGVFSLVTGITILALILSNSSNTIDTWAEAFIYGYMWDSTLQKFQGT